MASLPSGSREDVELVKIETVEFTLVIKGKPYHERYEGLKQYQQLNFHDVMDFKLNGTSIESVQVYNIELGKLTEEQRVRPIFFENRNYQILVMPKQKQELDFYHEYPAFRQAISSSNMAGIPMLTGSLNFQNEIGYSTFEIRYSGQTLLEVTLEIFPSKLNYRTDYQKLLEEVNDEIYNLAFHFIRKTYLGANTKLNGNPSRVEFYRLITSHFEKFVQAINRVEKQPHHTLETSYVKVRGDQLGKMDTITRKYIQRRNQFAEVEHGIHILGKTVMAREGIKPKKELQYNTLENQYIKWTMQRLGDKIKDLILTLENPNKRWKVEPDPELMKHLIMMKRTLEKRRKNPFWQNIGQLDRSVTSLVLQMAPGYREAYQTFLTVTKGLTLQNNLYKMSVKDVATLYEYWTFLKLGQILGRKYMLLSQDIVQVSRDGLYINLKQDQKAERKYEHPLTEEKITLTYQNSNSRLPTISQRPDTMLSISKKARDYDFTYVFDAKYRIDYALKDSFYFKNYQIPGPVEEDINTMHRYRDSLVVMNNGPYERMAFGAYVLFPWDDEEGYQEHKLYKSIDKVNIGGLPFHPKATDLVERFIERLIDKSPEEIQSEGILPRGSKEEWESSLEEQVLVLSVSNDNDYKNFLQNRIIVIPSSKLKKGWQEAKFIALYVTADVDIHNGIKDYGKIDQVSTDNQNVYFYVRSWLAKKQVIQPVKYGIATYIMTTLNQLKDAIELPELFMRNHHEMSLWRMLRRVSDSIKIQLDNQTLDNATVIEAFSFKDIELFLNHDEQTILIRRDKEERSVSTSQLMEQPSVVFKEILSIL